MSNIKVNVWKLFNQKITQEKQRVERTDHSSSVVNSHIFKHSVKSGLKTPYSNTFNIIEKGFTNNTFKHKIAEILLIKEMKPALYKQKKSSNMRLFN